MPAVLERNRHALRLPDPSVEALSRAGVRLPAACQRIQQDALASNALPQRARRTIAMTSGEGSRTSEPARCNTWRIRRSTATSCGAAPAVLRIRRVRVGDIGARSRQNGEDRRAQRHVEPLCRHRSARFGSRGQNGGRGFRPSCQRLEDRCPDRRPSEQSRTSASTSHGSGSTSKRSTQLSIRRPPASRSRSRISSGTRTPS